MAARVQGQLLYPNHPPPKKRQPGLCFPHGLSPHCGRSGCCRQLLYFKALGAKPRVSTASAIPTLPSLVHPLWPLGTRSVPGPPLYPQQPRALPVAALCRQRERQGLGDIPSCSTTDVREYRPGKKNTVLFYSQQLVTKAGEKGRAGCLVVTGRKRAFAHPEQALGSHAGGRGRRGQPRRREDGGQPRRPP